MFFFCEFSFFFYNFHLASLCLGVTNTGSVLDYILMGNAISLRLGGVSREADECIGGRVLYKSLLNYFPPPWRTIEPQINSQGTVRSPMIEGESSIYATYECMNQTASIWINWSPVVV